MQILPQEPQPETPTLEQLAVALGPFSPPAEFDHGEEFLPQPPRPLPPYLRVGSYARRQRGTTYNLIALGIMCLVLSPFVQGFSHYIHPLAWLHWIGLGLIVLAVLRFVGALVSSGRYDYVRNGTPLVGRVIFVGVSSEGTSEAPMFRYNVACEFDHPDTGKHQHFFFPSEDAFGVGEARKYACTLQPGDYVTLLALPGKADSTMRIYGLLGLDPELEFITKNGRPLTGMSPFSAIMVAFVVGLVILLIMGAFDLMMFSFPLSGDWKLPVAIACGGAIVGAIGALGLRSLGKSAPVEGQAQTGPGAAMFGGGLLGLIGAPILFMVLNSQLDSAQGKFEPIEIVQYWQTTHKFVVSDYEIEYRPFPGGETDKKHIRFSQMEQLGDAAYGVLDVSPGRFGYPWARGIYPVVWVPVEQLPAALREQRGRTYSLKYAEAGAEPGAEPNGAQLYTVMPAVAIKYDRFAACPDNLVEPAAGSFRTQAGVMELALLADDNVPTVPPEEEVSAGEAAP